jgi:hypothetical protein
MSNCRSKAGTRSAGQCTEILPGLRAAADIELTD